MRNILSHNFKITFLLCILSLFLEGRNDAYAEAKIIEYIDNEYGYTFQYPSDWKTQETPEGNEVGKVRVVLLSPTSAIGVVVTVGYLGRSISKGEFNNSPNRNEIVESLIDLTVEQYRKTSMDLKATEMVVLEKKVLPSEVGIEFYISTYSVLEEDAPLASVGMHAIPFGNDYIISFVTTAVLDSSAKKEKETLNSVFKSFHLIGEPPIDD